MTSITPLTNGGGVTFVKGQTVFTLEGKGFDTIAPNINAYRALVGTSPTTNYGSTQGAFKMGIRKLSAENAETYFNEYHSGLTEFYLGCIGDGVNPPIWVSRPI